MISEAVKLRKLEIKAAREQAQLEAIKELGKLALTNPILELVGGFVLVETLQRFPASRPIIGDAQGNIIEGGIAGIIAIQQLAPSLPYLTQAAGSVLNMVSAAGKAVALPALMAGL